MVVVPVDAEVHEAQDIGEEDRDLMPDRREVAPLRDVQLEDHDRDHDRDHAVAEGLEPVLFHAPRLERDQNPGMAKRVSNMTRLERIVARLPEATRVDIEAWGGEPTF